MAVAGIISLSPIDPYIIHPRLFGGDVFLMQPSLVAIGVEAVDGYDHVVDHAQVHRTACLAEFVGDAVILS